jgi:RNA polymerase sigma-70 factor (ECF subfamily)
MNPPAPQPAYPRVNSVETDDLALVLRMATGDESALAACFDRWNGLVHAIVTRILRDQDDVQDVVEEAFWQAWRLAPRYDATRGSVETWLLTMARTRALDRLRAARRRREESIGDDDVGSVVQTGHGDTVSRDDPSLDAEQSERRTLVREALRALPEAQRFALELAYFGGFSQSEIAERTQQPLGTVKTRVRAALQKLRQTLDVLREEAR